MNGKVAKELRRHAEEQASQTKGASSFKIYKELKRLYKLGHIKLVN